MHGFGRYEDEYGASGPSSRRDTAALDAMLMPPPPAGRPRTRTARAFRLMADGAVEELALQVPEASAPAQMMDVDSDDE